LNGKNKVVKECPQYQALSFTFCACVRALAGRLHFFNNFKKKADQPKGLTHFLF